MKDYTEEDMIKEFKSVDNVPWNYISSVKKLSENFIRKFKDKLNLYYVLRYQTISDKFRKELNEAYKAKR
jgi:hypothetical protein